MARSPLGGTAEQRKENALLLGSLAANTQPIPHPAAGGSQPSGSVALWKGHGIGISNPVLGLSLIFDKL